MNKNQVLENVVKTVCVNHKKENLKLMLIGMSLKKNQELGIELVDVNKSMDKACLKFKSLCKEYNLKKENGIHGILIRHEGKSIGLLMDIETPFHSIPLGCIEVQNHLTTDYNKTPEAVA